MCPNACIQAPAHFWSLFFSQQGPYYELYICAPMLVYKHQHILEACFSPSIGLTMNFTYVPKCLYTSTSAFVEACLSANNVLTMNFTYVPKRLYTSTSACLKIVFLPESSWLWTSHMCPNACMQAPTHVSMLLNRPHIPGHRFKYVPKCLHTRTSTCACIRMFICFVLQWFWKECAPKRKEFQCKSMTKTSNASSVNIFF